MFNFTTLNFSSILNLYDTLLVDRYLGRTLPSDFTEEDFDNLKHLTYWYSYFAISFNLSKAFNTPILQRVLEDFDDRISHVSTKTLKWTAMSAHDTNLFALTSDLNISSSECIEELYRRGSTSALNCYPGPEFASSLLFELHSDNSVDFFVKLRYNGEYVYLCEKVNTACSFEEWKQRVKQNIIIDYARDVCYGAGEGEADSFQLISDIVELMQ